MPTVLRVAETVQRLFGPLARHVAEETGLGKRRRVLTGACLALVLPFGWVCNPQASREELTQTACALHAPVSAQAIQQRLTEHAPASCNGCWREPYRAPLTNGCAGRWTCQRIKHPDFR